MKDFTETEAVLPIENDNELISPHNPIMDQDTTMAYFGMRVISVF